MHSKEKIIIALFSLTITEFIIKGNYEKVVNTLPAYIYLIYDQFVDENFEMAFESLFES